MMLHNLVFALKVSAWLVLVGFMLLVFYAAVMCFRDARDRKVLTGPLQLLGKLVLTIGYALDVFAQLTIAVILFLELPPCRWVAPSWKIKLAGKVLDLAWLKLPVFESTVSARTKRLKLTGTGWRKAQAIWWRTNILGPLDATGDHS